MVHLLYNPELRIQPLTNLMSILRYNFIGSINLLLTGRHQAISQHY